MHSKKKGNIGQFGVALAFAKLGYSVFSEEGDISKIDLIVEKNNKIHRIQCKAVTPIDDKIIVSLKKSGPNYSFKYNENMFDYFAVYDLEDCAVYLVSSSVLKNHNSSIILRKAKSKNNQIKNIHLAEDFEIANVLKKSA